LSVFGPCYGLFFIYSAWPPCAWPWDPENQ
jgi:hypothetical protein